MKIASSCIFLLVFLWSGPSLAQSGQQISVPLISENKEIDSLLDTVVKIKAPYYQYYAAVTKIIGDSCWRIEIYKEKYLLFQLAETNMPTVNYVINRSLTNDKGKSISNFGYFQYRGHKIFVLMNEYFDDFFTKSTKLTMFNFIYKLNKDAPAPVPQMLFRNVQTYKYFGSHFSPYVDISPGPPIVKPN
ncbi:MAG TPA: hypothetical protein VFE53_26525 [Mucilaginibacter sp.]|jgi:hypothetical protein|nr:hypothetical protein [Mucilaginibacter sp.]